MVDAGGTTIGIVATDARCWQGAGRKLAQMAHDGLARSINPVHTLADGDTMFALATGASGKAAHPTLLGAIAAEVTARAPCCAQSGRRRVWTIPACRRYPRRATSVARPPMTNLETSMSDTYVLVHGAWHTGKELEPAAEHAQTGHTVHCPTLAGNRPGDDRNRIGLEDAAQSLAQFLREHDLRDVRLAGHSYGGMVISRAQALVPDRIRRLVYVNAFVPLPGECSTTWSRRSTSGSSTASRRRTTARSCCPSRSGARPSSTTPTWRSRPRLRAAQPAPVQTFTDKIVLPQALAELQIGKSYVNCQQDVALPHTCRGTRGCRSGWDCSASSNARAATRSGSPTRRRSRARSSLPGATERRAGRRRWPRQP